MTAKSKKKTHPRDLREGELYWMAVAERFLIIREIEKKLSFPKTKYDGYDSVCENRYVVDAIFPDDGEVFEHTYYESSMSSMIHVDDLEDQDF